MADPQRGLCCFPNLRDRQDKQLQQLELPSKPDDIVMLERQGRSSQRMRSEISNAGSQVSSTTIPRLASAAPPSLQMRGASLPPPRNLKPPPRKNFGFTTSLKDDAATKVDYNTHNRMTSTTYQRLSPARYAKSGICEIRKRSLLPTPSAGRGGACSRPTHQYMPIGRSPSPAHFILGRTPTPSPQPVLRNPSKSRNY